jgi:hypothetical protein
MGSETCRCKENIYHRDTESTEVRKQKQQQKKKKKKKQKKRMRPRITQIQILEGSEEMSSPSADLCNPLTPGIRGRLFFLVPFFSLLVSVPSAPLW